MSEEKRNKKFSFDALSRSLENQLQGSSGDDKATGRVHDVTESDIKEAIRTSPTSVVTFYRNDCPYCERLMPILDELAEDYKSKVSFAKVNVDKFENTREEFDILGVPLVVAFKKGMLVERIEGLRPIDDYDRWIESIRKGLKPMRVDEGPKTHLD